MFAYIKAITATLFIAEVLSAFAFGAATVLLFTLHLHGAIFWGLEAIAGCAVVYASFLFFRSALAYEKSARIPVED